MVAGGLPCERLGQVPNAARKLAWVGTASSLVGLFDLIAVLVILNTWVSQPEYGVAMLAISLFPILDEICDLGLSAAVVQRDDLDHSAISTIWWVNITIATALFACLAAVAPAIADRVYGEQVVGYILIAYGTKLLWQNVYFIPMALMKRELRFKELSVIRIVANAAELAGKIGFAWAGFGIWCFVLGALCRALVSGIGCQLRHPWRPRFVLRLRTARPHIAFGMRTSASQLLFQFYTNFDYQVVGHYFGNAALGAYTVAYQIVLEPVRIISGVVATVAFPMFARLRHHRERLIGQLVWFTKLNIIVVMTYAGIVAVAAHEVIAVTFPEYRVAATAVRILCLVGVLRAISFVLPPLLDGVGHPERTLRYMVAASIVLPLAYIGGALALGDRLGFNAVAVAWAAGYPIAFAVLVVIVTRTLDWSVGRLLRAVAGVTVCVAAGIAVGAGVGFALPPLSPVLRLCAIAPAIAGTTAILLARTQGLGPRALIGAFRRDG